MRAVKDAYILFFVSALSAIIAFVTGIWLRNILGPEEYGVWLIFSLILTYGHYIHLGILDSFNRDIPHYLGQKNTQKAEQVRNIVFSWMLVSGVIALTGAIIIIALPLNRMETILGIVATLLIPLQNITLFHNIVFLTIQRFNVVAMIQLIIGSVQYMLMAAFAIHLGIYGLFLGVCIGNIMAIIYSRFKLPFKVKIQWNWKVIKGMFLYGIPIMLVGVLLNVFVTLDRLIILHFFGAISVGHYGITAFVYQGIMVLPKVLHQVIYPKISFQYGAQGEKKALMPLIVNPSILMSYYSPLLLGFGYLILPWFVAKFMPQYTEGTLSAQLVLLGLYFLLWAMLYAHYLNVVNKQWTLFYILLSVVIFNVLINFTFVYIGFHIEGIALGTAISYVIYPMVMMWLCFIDMGETFRSFLKHAALILAPFTIMSILLTVIYFTSLPIWFNFICFMSLYVGFIFFSSKLIPVLVRYPAEILRSLFLKLRAFK